MSSNLSLAGRIAIVTGAGAGMGRAHAELLAARGAHVVVQDVLAERTHEVVAGIAAQGGRAEALVGDASAVATMRDALAAIEARRGRIDILVNNAGISGRGAAFEAIDEATFDRMIAVHLKSAFFLAQAVVPGMKARRHGRIINVSSSYAMTGGPNMAHYTAAKGAMLGLTKTLARELGPWQITVNAIAPGLVKTGMTETSLGAIPGEFERRRLLVPMLRLAEPHDVAQVVAFLAADEAALVTGQAISPSGGEVIV
jgi:NAD(P)-dependent dehydrogenase (short-subunit alcohol dehydrogenase family)